MEFPLYTFKNSGEKINNDVIYPEVFELSSYSYTFLIAPKTKFWRFGIRLSKSEDIEFDNSKDRHINSSCPDIHLGVGDRITTDFTEWQFSNSFHLAQYHLPEYDHLLNRQETYIELGAVEWKIQYDHKNSVINLMYSAKGCQPFSGNFKTNEEYKFFKVFAWADSIDFELDCEITINSISNYQNRTDSQFTIGNVIFRLGNMFDQQVLKECDAFILPASTNGTAQENILEFARRSNMPAPAEHEAGALVFYELNKTERPFFGAWVYSVMGKNRSDINVITTICNQLLSSSSYRNITKVNLPLLGIGSGNLDPVKVASIYADILNDIGSKQNIQSSNFQFIVSVLEIQVFQQIQDHFENRLQSNTKTNPDIKSRLHSDNYNLDEADVLNYDLIAENLFTILTNKATTPPLNIGILAPWGRGKTSLMKRLNKKFDDAREIELSSQERQTKKIPNLKTLKTWLKNGDIGVKHNIPYATVWFNPWNYQSSDMIWAGLADAVVEQVVNQIPGKIDQEIFWMQLRISRIDKDELRKDLQIRSILYGAQFIIWALIIGLSILYFFIQNVTTALGVIGFGSILGLISSIASRIKPFSKTISETFDKYTKSPKYKEGFGTFHEVQNDLNRVLDLCIHEQKPLVVFVDDLDRCSPSKVVEVVEAINVFINGKFSNKCYFILGMDAEMVAAALDVCYEKMRGKMGSKELEQGSIGWYFLDKFIQLPFFIPVLSETKKKEYLQNLLNEREAQVDNINKYLDTKKIERVFTEVMSTDNIQKSSDTIKDASLSKDEKKELDKLILQNQVESLKQNEEINKQVSLYGQFISADPRSLKRFVNLLRFYCSYQFLRMKKGENYVEIKVLAKWLAIMIKFPQLVRWIQWDSENKSGNNTSAEYKAQILDRVVSDFIKNDPSGYNNFDKWLMADFYINETSKKIKDLEDMPWLKSRNMFNLIMNEVASADFKKALDCNVW